MNKKQIKKIIEKINIDNWNNWDLKSGKILTRFNPFYFDNNNVKNRIVILTELIGNWEKLLNSKKYIKEQLENYLKEIIIKKYFKNNEKITIKYEHDIHFTDISNNKEINEQE